MSLYFTLLLCSIFFPFVLSFDRKVAFYKKWPALIPAIGIVAFVFIVSDVFLSSKGVWGFNPAYHSNLIIFHLPIEEWLFFILIPYASLFIHISMAAYFPKLVLSSKLTSWISYALIVGLVFLVIFNFEKTYTTYISIKLIAVLIWSLYDKREATRRFFISFLIILLPFALIDGILTGSFIEGEVVWYNHAENLGIRLFTIPVEDFLYGFTLLLAGLLFFNRFQKKI